METKIKLEISQYSMNPGPRYVSQGDDSGEDFYHKYLNEKFKDVLGEGGVLEVNLDGPNGYASSFLDEAFGNLIYDFGYDTVVSRIKIISNEEPEWLQMLEKETFIEWKLRREKIEPPTKTVNHSPWYRFKDGIIEKNEGYAI